MKNVTKKLFISMLTAVFALVSLGTSTFAWFTTSNSASLPTVSASVKGGEGFDMTVLSLAEIDHQYDLLSGESKTYGNAVINAITAEGFQRTWRSGSIPATELKQSYTRAAWSNDTNNYTTVATRSGNLASVDVQFDALTPTVTVNGSTRTFNAGFTDVKGSTVAQATGKYMAFTLVFRSSNPGFIYVVDETKLDTPNPSAFTIDYAHKLAAKAVDGDADVDTDPDEVTAGLNEKYVYHIDDAARVAFVGSNDASLGKTTAEGTKVNVFEQDSKVVTLYSNENDGYAGNTVGFNPNAATATVSDYVGAVQYYYGKRGADITATTVPATYVTSTIGTIQAGPVSANLIAETETTARESYYYATVTVYVWIEGWDGECMNGIFRQTLDIDLAFRFSETAVA